jgi:hypothetical protein
VPRGQKACDECGSCERSGWSGEDEGGGLNLPDEDFDYDAFLEREFGAGRDEKRIGEGRFAKMWWWAGVVLLVAFAGMWLVGLLRG